MSTIYPIRYSFSGADCRAYGFFSEVNKNQIDEIKKFETIKIDSLATLSLSIHESKSPVRRLGHMAPSGYTRAIRTIAGSMILTIIGSDHPLKNLSEQDPKSVVYFSNDSNNSFNIVTKMSPFNLMLMYKSEIPNTPGSKMVIRGIDFINEGIVTSVNDLISEVVLQFVALDVEQFESEN
jgi:hypothetical protein